MFNEIFQKWDDIREKNPNSRLVEDESGRAFLPFKIKEIIDIIIAEYAVGNSLIEIVFEGPQDEYAELEGVCQEYQNIHLTRSKKYLENARFIRKEARETFEAVHPIIAKIHK